MDVHVSVPLSCDLKLTLCWLYECDCVRSCSSVWVHVHVCVCTHLFMCIILLMRNRQLPAAVNVHTQTTQTCTHMHTDSLLVNGALPFFNERRGRSSLRCPHHYPSFFSIFSFPFALLHLGILSSFILSLLSLLLFLLSLSTLGSFFSNAKVVFS